MTSLKELHRRRRFARRFETRAEAAARRSREAITFAAASMGVAVLAFAAAAIAHLLR